MKISTTAVAAEAPSAKSQGPFARQKRSSGGGGFFEFHDQEWFPKSLRDGVTDGLQSVLNLGGVYRPIVPLLNESIASAGAERVVDLCSGGSGPWPWLYRLLGGRHGCPIEICLTDKYPNLSAFESVQRETGGRVTFYPACADAANLPAELSGFRTIFTSFHHFTADEAVAILQNAVDGKQGIGIFEAARRHPLNILLTVLMPLGGVLTAPFSKPFRFSRLFWTYIIPVIPFVLFFDGVVSCLRAYSPKQLEWLVAQVKSENYVWRIGERAGVLAPITYLVGHPVTNDVDTAKNIDKTT